MAKFRKKPVVIEATQWFTNGDHPKDNCFRPFEDGGFPNIPREGEIVRYFRHPDIKGKTLCKHCGRYMHNHGLNVCFSKSIGQAKKEIEKCDVVCSNCHRIRTYKRTYPCKPDIFKVTYEIIKDEEEGRRRRGY